MVEIKEVLRLWRAGAKKKRIAAQLTLDVKTVRRYVAAAEGCGLAPGLETLGDEQVAAVVAALSPRPGVRTATAGSGARPSGIRSRSCSKTACGSRRSGGCCIAKASTSRTRRCTDSRWPSSVRPAWTDHPGGRRQAR